MKIEMLESLVVSYLRHIKGCQLVQLNWKASASDAWKIFHTDSNILSRNTSDDPFLSKYIHLFSKSERKMSVKQFLMQGEIDVLGVKLNSKGIESVFAIDTAYHLNGLNYAGGSKKGILKKLIRSRYSINVFMGDFFNVHTWFLTPFTVSVPEYVRLCCFFDNINLEYPELNLKFISEDSFREVILTPITECSISATDTSELFLRSWQLVKRSKEKEKKSKS